ncbi:MAG: response regulator, partial [Methylophilaceae bacterium]|nr:response regulator [Methylophilaceae bacterium]
VTIANDGEEVLYLLQHAQFDAILMDVHMPRADGIETTRQIRAHPEYADLPIIALTADVLEEERQRCLECGMNDFVAKPVNPETLVAALTRWIRPRPSRPTVTEPAAPAPQPAHGPLEALDGFDLRNALVLTGGDRTLLVELLLGFREDMKNLPADIRARAGNGDYAAARDLAHRLKGASGNLGAVALHAAAQQLEAELKAGRCDPDTFSAFEACFEKTMAGIDTLRQ